MPPRIKSRYKTYSPRDLRAIYNEMLKLRNSLYHFSLIDVNDYGDITRICESIEAARLRLLIKLEGDQGRLF